MLQKSSIRFSAANEVHSAPSGRARAFGIGLTALGLLFVYIGLRSEVGSASQRFLIYGPFLVFFGCWFAIWDIESPREPERRGGIGGSIENKGEEETKGVQSGAHENLVFKEGTVGSCIVCKGYLYTGDSIVSCPLCKGMAHKGDLLEWIHVKGTCPSCGHYLDEDDVQKTESGTQQ
jgi:hypothetical protein